MKIATRWRSFEEEQVNNLRITAILKQIFFRILQILICAPTSYARPIQLGPEKQQPAEAFEVKSLVNRKGDCYNSQSLK